MFLNISKEYPFPNDQTTYETYVLTGEDVKKARPLWEEVFSSDSQAFCDYYFSEKIHDNVTFVCLDDSHIIASVHMTDYTMMLDGIAYPTKYVVGVATSESYRHQGIMAHLLKCAFSYFKNKISFVFLMPADPAIYTPFGFAYVYERIGYASNPCFHLRHAGCKSSSSNITLDIYDHTRTKAHTDCKESHQKLLEELSVFANQTLAAQYDYYLLHTPEYFRKLILELHSENGYLAVLRKSGRIIGYYTFATEDGEDFIQEVLLDSNLADEIRAQYQIPEPLDEAKPLIMVKNLDDHDFISLLRNKKGLLNEIV